MMQQVIIGFAGLDGAASRYALVERIGSVAARRGVGVLGFGLGAQELRLVLRGQDSQVRSVIRGVKVGTGRALRRRDLGWTKPYIQPVSAAESALAWAHRAPLTDGAACPLSSPWSSHRDWLGFRQAEFFSGRGTVDRSVLHRLAGGKPLPRGGPVLTPDREPLSQLLRIAAAVRGVLGSDRRCFSLFVQVGRHRGWSTAELALALMLSRRRVRQLAGPCASGFRSALLSLADPRLQQVP